MKSNKFFILLFSAFIMSSCFKDEAPNAECDITRAWVHTDDWSSLFFNEADTTRTVLYSDKKIYFYIKPDADVTALAPQFEITEGATISPANGSVQDFSNGPVKYIVTSEDGQWTREYLVNFAFPKIPTYYSFDESGEIYNDPNLGARYNRWYEKCESGIDSYHSIEVFANANAGFALSNTKTAVEDYPSVVDMGYAGKGVRLTTCSTGPWGLLVRRPLAAGNFFIGEFDVEQALDNTLHTSRMGRVFDRKPYKVEGYYKYKAGKEFWKYVKGKVEKHPEIKDRAAIYAVFYRNRDAEGKEVMLFGEDSKTNPNIVAIAELTDIPETDSWTHFEMTFNWKADVDWTLLRNQGYNLTVVFSSSTDGAYYEGAPGSTLCIDDVRILCEEMEE